MESGAYPEKGSSVLKVKYSRDTCGVKCGIATCGVKCSMLPECYHAWNKTYIIPSANAKSSNRRPEDCSPASFDLSTNLMYCFPAPWLPWKQHVQSFSSLILTVIKRKPLYGGRGSCHGRCAADPVRGREMYQETNKAIIH